MNSPANQPLSSAVQNYLAQQKLDADHPLYQALIDFEATLTAAKNASLEEAVPAEMMQMFSDEQWPELRFEFQPSLQLFSAPYPVMILRRTINAGETPALPAPDETQRVLIFCDQDGQLLRRVEQQEYRALTSIKAGKNFAATAAELWPDQAIEFQHHQMTEQLLSWLEEGLIIDAGVPIPADAEYEQEDPKLESKTD